MGEITFAPDLPQPQCGKVFRRIPVLRLLLPGFFVQHPLHYAAVFGAAYALLPTGTIIALFDRVLYRPPYMKNPNFFPIGNGFGFLTFIKDITY